MGNDLTRTDRPLCGALIPDTRLEFWPEESANFDEASPFAGNPIETRSTGMTLSSSGTPENLDVLEVRSQFAGFAGFNGASFLYRQQTSPAQDWRGWDSPSAVTYSEVPTWTTSTTSGRRHPSITSVNNGVILAVADFPLQTGTGLRRVVRKRRASDGTWSNWSIVHTETANGTGTFAMLHPQAILRESGNVDLFHFHNDRINSVGNLMKQVSTDNGVTFEIAQNQCLLTSIDLATSEPERMRVAHFNGQYLLIVELRNIGTGDREIYQFASRDDGATFEPIGGAFPGQYPDLVEVGGFFILSYSVSSVPYSRRVGSAFSSLNESEEIASLGAGDFTSLAKTDNDELYYFAFDLTADIGYLTRSLDYGASWEAITSSQNLMRPFNFQSSGIRWPTMTSWRGSLVIASNNGGALAPYSMSVYFLGGFSTVTLPNENFTQSQSRQMGWQETYEPYNTLNAVTSATGIPGAGSAVAVADGLQNLTGLIGAPSRWTVTGSASREESLARISMSTTSGTSSLFLRSGDAVNGAEVEVRLTATTLQLFDVAGAVQIGSTIVTTPGTLYDVLVAVNSTNSEASAWYRERIPATDEREFFQLGSSSTVTDDGGTGSFAATTRALHYVGDNTVGGYDVDLAELVWQFSTTGGAGGWDRSGLGLAKGQSNPEDLFARNYTLKPTYLHDGISISATGITRRGDEFIISPRHTYEAENVIAIPSPRVGWRSLTTTADMSLAFRFPTAQTRWSNDQIGIYLDRINFKDFEVEVRQAGVWVSLGTFQTSYGVSFETVGDCIIPITTGANGSSRRYFYRNEMAGGTFHWGTGEVRPIVKNTSGIDNEGTPESKRVTWYLEPDSVTGLEPAGPASGAFVWYPRCLVLLSLAGDTVTQGIRITIRPGGVSPAPYQGYYEIGQLAIGEVFTFGWAPDNTRSVARELADEIIEEVDGTRSISKLGKVDRRRAEISWARNSRQTEIQNAGSPNYITSTTAAGAEPVASRFGTPIEFDGLLAEHGKKPLVYIPRFTRSAATSSAITAHYCRGSIYGRFVPDTYRVETAAGIAEETETVRTSVVTIEEEI